MQKVFDLSETTDINFGKQSSFNKEVGMFSKPYYILPTNFRIPFSDIKNIAKIINAKFDAIETLRYKYNESNHYWEIEFGTKPLEVIISSKDYKLIKIIDNKKWAAIVAARRAIEKYPYLLEELHEDNDYLPGPLTDLKWCRFVVNLYYDEEPKEIVIEFNRVWGDAHCYTFYQLFNYIKECFTN
jgi:hypothetical protein